MHAVDIYGLSEVMGPGVAQECVETKDGLHVWEDHFYPEVVDPLTDEVLPDGEKGELVFTSLTKQAMPVVRYRTRDLTRLLPGTARPMRRMEKVTGRSDDMIILRGVNLFPTQVEELILRTPELSPHFQCVLRRDGRLDSMTVRVERRPLASAADAARAAGATLAGLVKATIGVTVDVEVVEPDGIERSVGKMRRIVDERARLRWPSGPRRASASPGWTGTREELGASVFVGCEFVDADLTEVTTRGARFEDCEFRGGQLNASSHEGTSFTGCTSPAPRSSRPPCAAASWSGRPSRGPSCGR